MPLVTVHEVSKICRCPALSRPGVIADAVAEVIVAPRVGPGLAHRFHKRAPRLGQIWVLDATARQESWRGKVGSLPHVFTRGDGRPYQPDGSGWP